MDVIGINNSRIVISKRYLPATLFPSKTEPARVKPSYTPQSPFKTPDYQFPRWSTSCRNHRIYSSREPNGGESSSTPPRFPTLAPSLISAGTRGSIAVVLGSLLHIDPFGNAHFNTSDLLIGLELSLPLIVFSYFTMKVDYGIAPRLSFLSGQSGSIEVMTTSETKKEEMPEAFGIKDGLKGYQAKIISRNFGSSRSLPVIVLEWLVVCFPAEMLATAVGLTATGNWCRDRLSEAGLDDYFLNFGMDISTAGKWISLGAFSIFCLGLILARAKLPGRDSKEVSVFKKTAKGLQKVMGENNMDSEVQTKKLEKLLREASALEKLIDIIRVVLIASKQICCCSAFILTGNLASVLMTSGPPYILENYWKNLKVVEMEKRYESMAVGKRSIINTIKGKKYQTIRDNFRYMIEQTEKKVSSEKLTEEQQSQTEETAEEELQRKIEMELPGQCSFFNTVLKELSRALQEDTFDPDQTNRAIDEQTELKELCSRAETLMDENKLLFQSRTQLNFHRPMKDRYRGSDQENNKD